MYTDSHCHITCDRLYSRIDEIIENIKAKNLTSCMICLLYTSDAADE